MTILSLVLCGVVLISMFDCREYEAPISVVEVLVLIFVVLVRCGAEDLSFVVALSGVSRGTVPLEVVP